MTSITALFQKIWTSLVSVILISLLFTFFYQQREELSSLDSLISNAKITYIFLGLIIIAIYLVSQGLFFQACIRAINKSIPLLPAMRIYLKRFFVSTFVPTGFTVAQFAFTSDLKKYNIRDLESHFASLIYLFLGAIDYSFLLVPAIFLLLLSGEGTEFEVYSGAILIIFILLALIEFIKLFREQGVVYRLAPQFLPDLPNFIATWQNKSLKRKALFFGLIYAFMTDFTGILTFWASLQALNVPASFSIAFIGHILTILLLTISPLFQGIGLVEISLVFSLTRLGLSHPNALAVTLLYRLFQLWIPFSIGLILTLYDRVQTKRGIVAPKEA